VRDHLGSMACSPGFRPSIWARPNCLWDRLGVWSARRVANDIVGGHNLAMRHVLRKLLDFLMFGSTDSTELPPLSEEQEFQLNQYRMGLLSEADWRDLLDRDPNLSAHFKFNDPRPSA
jgi:hypothetical protein